MGQWLHDNASVLTALANIAMVGIWLGYLQLFYRQFRQSRLPQMMIHESNRHSLDADCLLVNMSREVVTVTAAMVVATSPRGEQLSEVSTHLQRDVEDRSPRQMEEAIKQGPMVPGMFLRLGSIRDLLDAAAGNGQPRNDIERLEIRVVLVHGTYSAPVGARRCYDLQWNDEGKLIGANATSDTTDQFRSRRHQRIVKAWLAAVR